MSNTKDNKDVNAFYYYLDYKFETLLDKEKNKILESKFNEFINLPRIISKNMLHYINKPEKKTKRKKFFVEICFLLFSSSTIKNKESLIYYIYFIFKSKKEEKLSIEKIIFMSNSLILTLLSKIEEKNYIIIFTLLLRINEILKHCFLEKSKISSYEFYTCMTNNPLSLEILEILFLCCSPINYNLIRIIKKFINEDNFNLTKNFYKLKTEKQKKIKESDDNDNDNDNEINKIKLQKINEKEKDESFLSKMLNASEEEKTFDENYTEELIENETSINLMLYKHRLSPQKNILNTKNLDAFLNTKVSGNLKFFHNSSSGNEVILENEARIFSFKLFSKEISFTNSQMEFFEISNKKYEHKFEDIDKYLYNTDKDFIELLNEKIDFSQVNKFSLRKLLLNLLEKCNDKNSRNNKFTNSNNKKEFKIFYKFEKIGEKNNNENSENNENFNSDYFTIRIIDKSFVFFKENKFVKIIAFDKFVLKTKEFEENCDCTFKDEENGLHFFNFVESESENGLKSFIEVYEREMFIEKPILRKNINENNKFKYLFEDLKKDLMLNIKELFDTKLLHDKEIREYFDANFLNPILNKIINANKK